MVRIDLNGVERSIGAIVFDMDNTLFDFIEAKKRACRRVTGFLGLDDGSELLDYFLRDGAGFEDVECIADYLKDRGIFGETVFVRCCEIYEDTKLNGLELYGGVEETLEILKENGFQLAVVSNADRKNLNSRLNKTGLYRFFDTVVSRDETGKAKPELEPILSALESLGVEPDEALKVGDSLERDIYPAKRLGMATAYAEYGDRNVEKEGGIEADFRLKNIGELTKLLGFPNE